VIVINPGLGFGTGQHPTTDFCLRQLVAHRKSAGRQSFLDIGTGSGILALAAAKLGYAPIEAFDCDPEAVRIARVNARRNRVFDRIRLRRADLTKLPERSAEQFDLICANLESTLLVSQRQRILARLKPNGVLVIAGILRTEFEAVRKGLVDAGLEPLARCAEREWCSGAFSAAPGQRFSAVILAGGQSRRMGRDKAWVEINGQTLLARALATVRDAGIDEVFISGREGTAYASLGCPVLHDARPGRGPLGGIVAGLSAAHSPLLLVLAVDLARMTSAFIRKLKVHCTANTGVVPVLSGRLEPLAAIYPTRYHRVAGQLLKKSRAAHELAELCRRERAVRTVAIAPSDARFFLNCNTRADLAAARRQR
jgi:molybdopterin-guanine dinucleotide biosynthesis protein A/precorrin-6B methylase 2